jgi:phosphate-selective porin OprO/OprP
VLNHSSKRGIALLAVTFAIATSASAADTSNQELDQRLKVVERQLEISKEDAETRAKDASSANAGEKGFSLKSAKGDYELKLRALAQVDGRFFLADQNQFRDQFLLRRLRPTFEAWLGKFVGLRLTPEFAAGAGTSGDGLAASIVDAYIDLKFAPWAGLRVGKQKGPVGLERLQSGSAISFIERGYVTELVPNRDIGAALFGEVGGGVLSYAAGIFNGTADGRDIAGSDADNRHEFEGRVFSEPLKNSPGFFQGLGFGVGGTHGSQFTSTSNVNNYLPRYRSPGQNQFFNYVNNAAVPASGSNPAVPAAIVVANGTHTRLSPQLYFYRNSFGLLGEYATSKQDVLLNADARTFTHKAWNVEATYVLTGENASFRGVIKPQNPYKVGEAGWGAFEVLTRVEELKVDADAFAAGFADINRSAKKARSYGTGVNWYLTANAKVVVDYNFTQFDGGGSSGADRRNEKAVFTRLQLSY